MELCNLNSCSDFNARHTNKCGRFNDVEVCDKFRSQSQAICGVASCPLYDEHEDNNCGDMCEPEEDCKDYINKNEMKPKTEKKTMDEFDTALSKANNGRLTAKVDKLTTSAKETATRTKNTVVRVKVGRLAISAIKSALRKTPGVPVPVKIMLDSPYAGIVIGAVVPIILPMITTNEKAIRLGEDIAIAGGVAIADELTFIDDFVADIVNQISDLASDATPAKKEKEL